MPLRRHKLQMKEEVIICPKIRTTNLIFLYLEILMSKYLETLPDYRSIHYLQLWYYSNLHQRSWGCPKSWRTLTETFTDETWQRTSETHSWSSSQPKLLFFNNLESSRKTLQLPSYQQKLVLKLTWSENTKLQICSACSPNLTANFENS